MALIDELKKQREACMDRYKRLQKNLTVCEREIEKCDAEWADFNVAIAALEPPAQPLDELRTVPPATVEESGDQLNVIVSTGETFTFTVESDPTTWTPSRPDAEITVSDLDKLATKATAEERAGEEIPEGFTMWEGGECPVPMGTEVCVVWRLDNGECFMKEFVIDSFWEEARIWGGKCEPEDDPPEHAKIIAYRIIEAPASEQDASVEIEPTTDLWQQGYNDKLNGFEPSLAEPEYTKGYEARALIEREHSETMERAKFFEGGMMADADRHQSDQRSIVEKVFDAFKSKEPA